MKPKFHLLVAGLLLATVGTGLGQPTITSQPQSRTNLVGTTAEFSVVATGSGTLTYLWQVDFGSGYNDLTYETEAMLVLPNVQLNQAADYRVRVTDANGATTSEAAHLYVVMAPTITSQPTNFSSAVVGLTTGNRAYVAGTGPLSYQWWFNGAPSLNLTNAGFTFTNVQLAQAGDYSVVVTNDWGSVTSRVVILTVYPAHFEDVTVKAGITNAPGPGYGAAWSDYNNDGFIDVYLALGLDARRTNALFRNNGNGTFRRVGAEAGPITTNVHNSWGCVWIDFNNDGYRDLFVVNGGFSASRNDLYWNNGNGTFGHSYLTSQSLVEWAWPACADYDGDGWVDIYLAEGTSTSGPWTPRLYHNTGSGTFTPVDCLGPRILSANTGAWGDYDSDGDPDLFTSNGSSPCVLWRNEGNGQFTSVNVGLPTSGVLHSAWADFDRDGDLDLAMSTSAAALLYRNEGGSNFVRAAQFSNGSIAVPAWADYDNDGYLDLFLSCVGGGGTPRNSALYHNNGDGTLSNVVDVITEAASYRLVCPWGDFDNDGFMDLMLTHESGQHRLYRNVGNTNHWIKFKLVGTASNRDAIGAKVQVLATIGGRPVWQMQEVNGGYAYQNDTRLNFGLGDATRVDLVRIQWPSGNVQELPNLSRDVIVPITEGTYITPVRPSASLGGSVTLTASRSGTWQWYHEGVALEDQTNRTLNLSNIQLVDGGRYSVVTSSGGTFFTNFVYLFADTQFTKITTAPMCTDRGYFFGCAWGDYDNDGFSDLFIADGAWFRTTTNHLYRNKGDGTFARMTTTDVGSIVGDLGGWRGCAWGDYNNDGFLDLLVTKDNGFRHLYHNNGNGRFIRVTTNGPPVTETGYAHGVSWGDYDSDGFLDLFMATAPGGYNGSYVGNSLYHNKGDGTFIKITTGPIPADRPTGGYATFGGAWADFDNDGDLDLVAGGGTGPKFVYRNDGAGQFSKITSGPLAQDSGCTMFFSCGDYDNDGLLDLFSGEWNQQCRLFHNEGAGQFSKMLFPAGSYETRGGVWGDYDNDGYLDLFIPIGGNNPGQSLLYRNNGDGTFTKITTGSLCSELGHTIFAAWCDYDNDGCLDLFVDYGFDEPNALYHNNGNNNSWLLFKLVGTKSNRAAIGAKVRVKAIIGGTTFWQMREISGGDGVQNDLRPHFGLGNATAAQLVRVEWPSGIVEEFANVAARRILTIVEPSLKGSLAQDGKFHVAMTISTNRVYELQASTDLVNWTTLTNCTGSGSCTPTEYVDPAAPTAGAARFYRLK